MITENLAKARTDPRNACHVGCALFRGFLIKSQYRLFNPQVTIGKDFRAYCNLRIIGPGRVVIGDKVSVNLSFLRVPTIVTYCKDSEVRIGNGCYLGGIRISCVGCVTIGDEILMGSTTVIDSDIIPNANVYIDETWKKEHAKPMQVGSFVWAGINSFILGGATIGDECVLGAGSVFGDKEAPERSLLVGNPARKIGVTR